MFKNIFILLSAYLLLITLVNANETVELDSNAKESQIFLEIPVMTTESIKINSQNDSNTNKSLELSILDHKSKHGFWESVIAGFTIIYASEIGDKTFLLCLIFSIKYGPYKIFFLTSVLMVLGNAFWMIIGASVQMLLSEYIINWIAIALFFTFAVIMLLEGLKMDDSLIINEMHELEEEIERKESHIDNNQELTTELINKDETELLTTNANSNSIDKTEHKVNAKVQHHKVDSMVSILCGYGFTLIFAECGDVSQITAIAIAALYNFKGVLIGASLAHIGAALTSVCCGQLIAKHVSERTITFFGSGLFFVFGILFFASNVGLLSINL